MFKARVALAQQRRKQLQAKETAKVDKLKANVAEIQAQLAAAEARVVGATAHREAIVAAFDENLAALQAKETAAVQEIDGLRARIAANGIDDFSVEHVHELLRQLQIPVPITVLQREEVTGIALTEITEGDMADVFGIATLGDRRRLTLALRRLNARGGFDPVHTPEWDVERVCTWLADEGMAQYQEGMREQRIDGEVLLSLTQDDLDCIGITTLGGRATLIKKIKGARKQNYVDRDLSVGVEADVAESASLDQLNQVLQENATLAERVKAEQGGNADGEPPKRYLCPILQVVMRDPVVAADGFTYEREAIETWFRRRNTSPMTNQAISQILYPNNVMRREIANWNVS